MYWKWKKKSRQFKKNWFSILIYQTNSTVSFKCIQNFDEKFNLNKKKHYVAQSSILANSKLQSTNHTRRMSKINSDTRAVQKQHPEYWLELWGRNRHIDSTCTLINWNRIQNKLPVRLFTVFCIRLCVRQTHRFRVLINSIYGLHKPTWSIHCVFMQSYSKDLH